MSTLFTSTAQRTAQERSYKVAAIQYETTPGEKEQNILQLLRLTEEAIAHDARLIVLPAMAPTGQCWISRAEAAPFVEPIPGPTVERFQQLATASGCYIALGLPEVDPTTHMYYNSMALLGPSGLVGSYRQMHSAISDPRWARDGDLGVQVWDTPLGRISPLISMDAFFFEPARIAALGDADVILYLAGWSAEACPSGWWMARAFENGLYLIAANRCGQERGLRFGGGSCVLNPDGTLQSCLGASGNGIVYGYVDPAATSRQEWLADRYPDEYLTLTQNCYLWEPLRYHSLFDLGELPTGQLSGAGILQMDLAEFNRDATQPWQERMSHLRNLLQSALSDNAPAVPDILVLPELLLPGGVPASSSGDVTDADMIAHFRKRAIQVPGPETDALVVLAGELQVSLVLGVAERAATEYYNTVLLLDPEGVYGIYRKIHLSPQDRLWATSGDLGLPTFDTPTGRVGLATGYDVLFPETLRVLASKGCDLVCAPTLLAYPDPIALAPSPPSIPQVSSLADSYDQLHFILWRIRAAEHNLYLALANWSGALRGVAANGYSGIFSPSLAEYPWSEVVADPGELGLMLMTIDTREQRTGRRTTRTLDYSPGDMAGSLTGELAYNILDTIPGNSVRSKPFLRKRLPFWYLDLVKTSPPAKE